MPRFQGQAATTPGAGTLTRIWPRCQAKATPSLRPVGGSRVPREENNEAIAPVALLGLGLAGVF